MAASLGSAVNARLLVNWSSCCVSFLLSLFFNLKKLFGLLTVHWVRISFWNRSKFWCCYYAIFCMCPVSSCATNYGINTIDYPLTIISISSNWSTETTMQLIIQLLNLYYVCLFHEAEKTRTRMSSHFWPRLWCISVYSGKVMGLLSS